MPRFFSLLDIGVITVVAVAIFLPSREMYASNAIKGDGEKQFALALAEARTMARPGDGHAVEDLTKKLAEADMKDWAVEAAVKGSERAKESPTRWRALMAASVAYVEELDVLKALDYANRALASCETAREKGDAAACPSHEEIRMRIYQLHLDAGVRSKIDPKRDPAGFRAAGQRALQQDGSIINVHIGGSTDRANRAGSGGGSSAPAPAPSPAPTP